MKYLRTYTDGTAVITGATPASSSSNASSGASGTKTGSDAAQTNKPSSAITLTETLSNLLWKSIATVTGMMFVSVL